MSFSAKSYLREKKKVTFAFINLLGFFSKVGSFFNKTYFFFFNKNIKKSLVNVLSRSTIIVETSDFKKALTVALKHFNTKDDKQLIWKKIFYKKPSKGVVNNAFKFISMQTNKDFEYIFELDNDYTVNISSVVHMETTRKGKFLRLNILKNRKNFFSPALIDRLLNNLKVNLTLEKRNYVKDQIIKGNDQNIKIGSWIPNPKIDGRAIITFNELKTEAYLTMQPPDAWGKEVDLEDVVEEIKRLKIKTSYSKETIKDILRQKIYNEPHLMIKLETSIKGEDAYIEEIFKSSNFNHELEESILAHYKEIFLVKKDQLLVVKHESRDGKDVVNLLGEKIMGEKGKDFQLKKGKNTYRHKNKIFSKTDGCVYRVNENEWVVEETLMLPEINNKFTKVEHNGTIIVNKSIANSGPIIAAKDLIVGEGITNSTVRVGNNISVQLGIIGKKSNVIESTNGSLRAKYIQNVTVIVRNDITVQEIINNCELICGDQVKFTENKGSIWGGKIQVKNQITVYNLGSLGGLKTLVYMGYTYDYMVKMRNYELEMNKRKEKIRELNLSRQKFALKESLAEEINKKIKILNEEIYNLKDEKSGYHYSFISTFNPQNTGLIKILSNFYSKVDLFFLNQDYKNVYHKKSFNIYYSRDKDKIVFEKT